MRAMEILCEDYQQRLESELNNFLISATGAGQSELDTGILAKKLYSMGYSVNVNSLMSLLQNNPAVTNITPEIITLAGSEISSPEQTQDSAAQVSDMAAKATKIS